MRARDRRERQRETERDRESQRQTKRDRDRQRETERQRQTEILYSNAEFGKVGKEVASLASLTQQLVCGQPPIAFAWPLLFVAGCLATPMLRRCPCPRPAHSAHARKTQRASIIRPLRRGM